jgi:alkylhydroperoxidase/carboxymuconolactone decarboxylase family protein YurZ
VATHAAGAYGREAPFWEAAELLKYTPQAPDVDFGNYVHHYEEPGQASQSLSTQMRELIATLMLTVMGHQRFATRHIRRLYRLGVTSQVVIDTFWAASPFIGRAHVLTGMRLVHAANDPSNLEGTLPADGAPTELLEFPELHLGNAGGGRSMLETKPEWQLVAQLDPQLSELALTVYDRVMGNAWSSSLPVGARELIAIVCLSWRGLENDAADHIRAALACKATPHQIVEALASAMPMTGMATLQVGARALLLVQTADANNAREAMSAP